MLKPCMVADGGRGMRDVRSVVVVDRLVAEMMASRSLAAGVDDVSSHRLAVSRDHHATEVFHCKMRRDVIHIYMLI
jgi:pyruvate carboxylase